MITVTATSTDEYLTTTAAVKLVLGVETMSDDPYLSALIKRASRRVETYLGRGPVTLQSYRESLSGYGDRTLMLARRPVQSVSSLWDSTSTGSATTIQSSEFRVENREAGFLDRDAGWAWDAPQIGRTFAVPLAPTPFAGQEEKSWLCDYAAGWTLGGVDTGSPNWSTEQGSTSTGRTLPEDVEEAVILWTIEAYTGQRGVIRRKVGDLSIDYARSVTGKQVDPAEELLASYRSVL